MARNSLPSPDPEDMRKDLLAALAAGRELGPEMDTAIVDAHLRRHFGEAAEKPKPPAAVQRPPLDLSPLVMPLTLAIGVVALVAILYFSHGALWFLAFPLLGWWRWGGRYSRGYRNDRWAARQDDRWDRDGSSLDRGQSARIQSANGQHEII